MVTLPLNGLRVIDLTHYTAGPYCTRMLADYGADVIKIERPPAGDPARTLGPFYRDKPDLEKSGLFLFLNTNKRSVTLNLKTKRGRAILLELVRRADILVENFSPRVMPGLGLDYEALRRVNPRLVMTSISNFGQTGPYRDWAGTDLTLWGMGGSMIVTGDPDREPVKPAGHAVSYHVGHMAAMATMIALFAAELWGEGEHLDISFFEVCAHAIDSTWPSLIGYQYTKYLAPRGSAAATLGLGSGVYPCADGYFITTAGPAMFPAIARMVGAGHLLEQPEWATPAARSAPERADEFEAIIVPWMLERTKKEARALCQQYGVLGGPFNTMADLLADEHFQARGYFQVIDHPVTGPLTYPGYNFTLHTGEPMPPRRRAPLLGEHTAEVLCDERGYTKAELRALREQGVI